MDKFPRTMVGGVSMPRMIIGANWFLGYSHTSQARDAKKPVMTIKPLAAGRLMPPVGLAFVWNTIRDQDMVTIGTTTSDEAREVIELSFDFLNRRIPGNELQSTRSKQSLSGKHMFPRRRDVYLTNRLQADGTACLFFTPEAGGRKC